MTSRDENEEKNGSVVLRERERERETEVKYRCVTYTGFQNDLNIFFFLGIVFRNAAVNERTYFLAIFQK